MCVTKSLKIRKNLKVKVYSITETLTALEWKSLLKHVIVLVSLTCGLKTGKFYVRKTTALKSFLTNWVQEQPLGGVPWK